LTALTSGTKTMFDEKDKTRNLWFFDLGVGAERILSIP
jgi:hypothetical protein